ncbi:MAG: hypothetical protein HUJ54_12235 [Erysipelotrichaceae bacterium]|nr:hypothetical protein [Erysipelotrichaceae bacterium]
MKSICSILPGGWYTGCMDSLSLLSVYEACRLMKQGIKVRHASTRMLAAMDQGRVLLVSDQMSARMSEENFCEIYEEEKFSVHQSRGGIDEQKDEEYYAWRARSQ